jgi:cellulose synthase/poly-beta-1,6-N-acetylglucosamine synthase-like glycosyltransferase
MVLLSVTIFFLLMYAGLILFYRKGWRSLPDYQAGTATPTVFVSVLIPARNEATTIGPLLAALAEQTYPSHQFEVIVIDDYSTDRTAAIVNNNSMKNLRLIKPEAEASRSSKKKAIEAGVHAAKGSLILTTDADCIPPPKWIHTMADFHSQTGAAFIAAPVCFNDTGKFFQRFQSLDFLTLQGITAASVAMDFHTMCNGANLAYTRQSFMDVNGFEGIDHVATGDDMLLMYKIRKKNPGKVLYLKSRDAIVRTAPMPGWKEFIEQRKRWASKTLVYDDRRIIAVLVFVYLLNCFFIVLLAAWVMHAFYGWYVLGFLLAKTLIELSFVSSVARFYRQERLLPYIFLMQPLHIFYTVAVGFISQLGQYEWKGRKTK